MKAEVNMNKKFWVIIKIFAIASVIGIALFLTACEDEAPPDTRPMIALTFDDGPDNVLTNRILDVLAANNARATFYVVGNRIEEGTDTIKRALSLGNEVAGHSWDHSNLRTLAIDEGREAVRAQLEDTANLIEAISGIESTYLHFRPPFGVVNRAVMEVAEELGYAVIGWTLDTSDWVEERRDAQILYDFIMKEAWENDVILLHDIWPSTADAMEIVIPELVKRFRLVTITELFEAHYPGALAPGAAFGTLGGVPVGYPRFP